MNSALESVFNKNGVTHEYKYPVAAGTPPELRRKLRPPKHHLREAASQRQPFQP